MILIQVNGCLAVDFRSCKMRLLQDLLNQHVNCNSPDCMGREKKEQKHQGVYGSMSGSKTPAADCSRLDDDELTKTGRMMIQVNFSVLLWKKKS